MQPAIFGLSGERLTADERDFFRDSNPAGYILFKRNCADRDQLRALTDELRGLHGREDVPILVDQEGGRVARLKPPIWPAFPPAQRFADLYQVAPISAIEAARVNAHAIALMLKEVGVNVDCMPVLDIRRPGAHDIVGDRAFGSESMQVAALGRAVIEGLRAGGVVGVVKHMPGHGRSTCDSHEQLPVVAASEEELEIDIEPFRSLRAAPMGMAAHIVYTAWDAERCASLSPTVIHDIIRTRIGFDGLLMSDDIMMHALTGGFGERARGVLEAGCDVALHCSGALEEMVAVADAIGEMAPPARERLERAMASVANAGEGVPYEELAAKRDALLAYA
jgi:beta-N-acetylhexosaminidase